MNRGHASSTSPCKRSSHLSALDVPRLNNDDDDDDENSKWSNSTASLDFNSIKNENFQSFLNDDYSIHKNDEALLADFTALLDDGEDTVLMNVDANIPPMRIDGEIMSNSITQSNCISSALSTTAMRHESTDSQRIGTGGTDNQDELLVVAAPDSPSQQMPQSQSLLCIGSIMSDHDYLSRENTLEIIGMDESQFFSQQEKTKLANTTTINNNTQKADASTLERVKATSTCLKESEELINGTEAAASSSKIDTNVNAAYRAEFDTIFSRLANDSLHKQTVISLLDNFEERVKTLKMNLSGANSMNDAAPKPPSTSSHEIPEENVINIDRDVEFSPNHSEPLEYYGNIKEQMTSDQSDSGQYRRMTLGHWNAL